MGVTPHLLLLLFLDLDARQHQVRRGLEEARGLAAVMEGSRGRLAGAPSLQKLIVSKVHAELDDLRREEIVAALCSDARW